MHRDHDIFIQAIKGRKKILIKHSDENGCDASTKVYCPIFYVPSGDRSSSGYYYVWEDEKGPKGNITSVKTENIVRIGQTQEPFDLGDLNIVNNEAMSPED